MPVEMGRRGSASAWGIGRRRRQHKRMARNGSQAVCENSRV